MTAFRLPYSINPDQLCADLEQVAPDAWINHYRPEEYEGGWAITPLRSVSGHPAIIHAVPVSDNDDFFKSTPLLDRCPAFREALSVFQCRIGSARLMRLDPGARILEHRDDMGEGSRKEIRLHLPIQTNDDVHFWVNNERVRMQAGEWWYADFSQLHHVENNSQQARIHLVVDCLMNDWLEKVLQTSQICCFLDQIGIETSFKKLPTNTFLPGIAIKQGTLEIDIDQVLYPGDLLHEAGHIAVTTAEERPLLHDNVGENDPNAMGFEIAAILWSYAALKASGLPENVVFHEQGYKGQSEWHIANFKSGCYVGLPLLTWMGLTDEAFPAMQRWLRV